MHARLCSSSCSGHTSSKSSSVVRAAPRPYGAVDTPCSSCAQNMRAAARTSRHNAAAVTAQTAHAAGAVQNGRQAPSAAAACVAWHLHGASLLHHCNAITPPAMPTHQPGLQLSRAAACKRRAAVAAARARRGRGRHAPAAAAAAAQRGQAAYISPAHAHSVCQAARGAAARQPLLAGSKHQQQAARAR